jgi:rubrerythrin
MPVTMTSIGIFEFALRQEFAGRTFFEESIDRMGISEAATAFERLVQEEEMHIRFIERVLDALRQGRQVDPSEFASVDLPATNFFRQRAASELLDSCVQSSMTPDVAVFDTAWRIERDLAGFYNRMASQTVGKVQEALALLGRWEGEHEKYFRELRDVLTSRYGDMPWGG